MAGKELGFLKPSVPNLKEQLARKTLRNLRLQGHTYVDLREDGKRFIFFCTLCLSPCYSDATLLDHLRGNLHKQRYAAAKATLIGKNPWPFDDGIHFFHCNVDEEKDGNPQGNDKVNLLDDGERTGDLSIVVHSDDAKGNGNGHVNGNEDTVNDCLWDESCSHEEHVNDLIIPGVVGKEEISDLHVKFMGYGQISARLLEKDGGRAGIHRMWCEWLGKRGGADDKTEPRLPVLDFAVVTFGYYYDLGKQGLFDDIKMLLLNGEENSDDGKVLAKRRKKSFSDSEEANEGSSYHCYSSGEDLQGSTATTSSALLLHCYDDQLLNSGVISSKKIRKKLRKQQRVASEKMCDICRHKMLPGKDVATLLNLKTGRLACSSRNVYGAFHVFHTSCVIHWILLCESEMLMKPPVYPKVTRKSKRTKSVADQSGKDCRSDGFKRKRTSKDSEQKTFCDQINSVLCPDCQGTGLQIEGDERENPTGSLSEMFKYKIKASDAYRAWMKSPEELDNCSTGFAFPVQIDDAEEKVENLKLLKFYRANEDSWFPCS